jgi:hypothetical protein
MTEQETVQYLIMQSIEEDCKINAREIITYPPVAISLGENLIKTKYGDMLLPIPIGTYGNFSVVSAPPKTKKTFLISLLTSVYLSGSNNFGGNIKGHREDRSVLHFDTEQGKWHAQRVFKRVLDMSDSDYSKFYLTFGLRTIGFKQRIEFIEYCLENKAEKIGLVIIDGIADLVSDVKIMEWSTNYNCHIICVIHSNFGSEKMTGHLGSFIEKKTETQIQLEANTANKEWITVKCKRSRGYSFETFSFQVNELGLPEIVGDLYDPLKN